MFSERFSDRTVNLGVFQPRYVEEPLKLETQISNETITLLLHPERIYLTLNEGEEIILGRAHPTNAGLPLVDLSKFGATAHGMSRIHATLRRVDGMWWIEDMGSSNGTWLNGERLAPHTPQPLKGNSQLLLANFEINVVLPQLAGVSRAA